MNANIDLATKSATRVFAATQLVLDDHTSDDKITLTSLVNSVSSRLSAEASRIDPIVRFYVRTHSDWVVTNGRYGGLERVAIFNARQEKKQKMSELKEETKQSPSEEQYEIKDSKSMESGF
jgi:hypothetical protein